MMICTKTVSANAACTNAWGSVYASTAKFSFGSWPVAFTEVPIVSANIVGGSLEVWLEQITSVSKTVAGESFLIRPTSATNTVTVNVVGFGMWK